MSVAIYDALNTAIYQVLGQQPSADHSLDHYLYALWQLAYTYHDQPTLPAQQFVDLLAQALVTPAPTDLTPKPCDPQSGFASFQSTLSVLLKGSPKSKACPKTTPLSSTVG